MKKILPLLILLITTAAASAQQYVLSGRIRGQQNEPVGFTSVYIRNSTYSTTANEDGLYQFKLTAGTYHIVYRFVGYREQVQVVTITDHDVQLDVNLEAEIFEPANTTSEYNRKTDRGMDIMHKVLAYREMHMDEFKTYKCAVYIKGVQKLVSAPKSLLGGAVMKQLDLDSNGRGILYQSESLSQFNLQRPNKFKEIFIASKMAGENTAFSYNKASDLQVNLYDNIFYINGLSSRGFISPVASNAFAFYRYRLEGTTVSNGRTIFKIEVIPRHKYEQAFKGYLYIVDKEWRIYSADLLLNSKDNNINLIDTLRISQQYVPILDSVWLPTSVQFDFKGDVLGFKFEGYYLGIYNNYRINQTFPDDYFDGEVLRIDTAAKLKSAAYWANTRPVPLTPLEARYYEKKDSIAAVKKSPEYIEALQHTKNNINYFTYLIWGYNASSRNEKDSLYVYPFLQTFYYNTVEGFGINAKVRYTKVLDDFRTFSVTPALRYGFSNKLFSANVHSEYKNDPFHHVKFYTDFGSDILDLNNVGTRSLYFNTLSTLFYNNNYVKYYRSQYGDIGYQREIKNGILWSAELSYATRTQLYNTSFRLFRDVKDKEFTPNNPLAPPGAHYDEKFPLFPQNQALTFKTSLTFTFDQKYITRPTGKTNLPSKYPTLTLNYRKGINNILGSDVNYDFLSADISQYHIRIGLSGYSSFKLTGGDFLNRKTLYFMDYNHFLGNQGTTFDPTYIGSFHFLPFYTYSTNGAFLEAHYQHNFSGSIFNKIPFLRKLKLEEIIGANYLTTRDNRNYREFYVGIQRLIFRVDYGVSYTDNKKYIQGIRIFYGIR
ncbi:DUF5686 family protein [Mucilaginibacter segetis]|uniref:Carboxypeptidase-like regulatory domain-containing protein n=1 Tax=Mucilaginibacter segetis TaxID=2793071 RepID=A0A934PUU8_9SPHI|nr:DUF5686 family protein [Mucilaginibacter segetis]MBK0381258.1 carboxypeptidase-like regulatory domain-containing protein [Mucilaginibacter segetis]